MEYEPKEAGGLQFARWIKVNQPGFRQIAQDDAQADGQQDVRFHAFTNGQQHKRSPQQEQESVTPAKVCESGF